jgi:hypothetical protein
VSNFGFPWFLIVALVVSWWVTVMTIGDRNNTANIERLIERVTRLERQVGVVPRTVLHERYPLGIDREGREIWEAK